jgi:hypothetical protein
MHILKIFKRRFIIMKKSTIIMAGVIIGLMSVALVQFGNPANMGVCIACFLRDIAGALGLHRAEPVQYIRPEIIGIVAGATGSALFFKEFSAKGGSSPLTRFLLGMAVMIGALIFLGCPLRMILRLAAGDLNALVALAGFVAGIGIGIVFLNKGFSLKRNYRQNDFEGLLFPIVIVSLFALLLAAPAFIFFSQEGPGSLHAPILIALAAGLVTGVLAQRTRLCTMGGIRDVILFRDYYLLLGILGILVAALVGNFAFGGFTLGFEGQPIAHTDGLWNFLGMLVTGWGSVLLGGCPLRQLILSSEGNSDSAVTVLGLLMGAAVSHNFGLASSAKGATVNGQIAVVVLIMGLAAISILNVSKELKMSKESKEAA